MERRVARDARIIDKNVNRSEVGLDLLQALGAFLVIGHVPFIGRNGRHGLETRRRRVIAGVSRRDVISRPLQSYADGRADPTRSAAHYRHSRHFHLPKKFSLKALLAAT